MGVAPLIERDVAFRAVAGQDLAQRRAGKVGAVLGYETIEPEPAAALAAGAADLKVGLASASWPRLRAPWGIAVAELDSA